MKKNHKQGSISIELLPEFGLPVNGIPAYFTGSVFQGFVNVLLPKNHKAERLRIIFHASETVQLHSTMTSVIRGRDHQLFGTQRILWERSPNNNNDEPLSRYRFTIQLPMVQLPPSLEYKRLRYKSKYKLTAILDYKPSYSLSLQPLLVCHQPVQYQPWIPTRALKVPMIRHSKWIMIQMPNTDLLPGEKLQFQVSLSPYAMSNCLRSSLLGLDIVLELIQRATFPYQMEDERIPPSETILKTSPPTLIHAPPSSLQPILEYNNVHEFNKNKNNNNTNLRRPSSSSSSSFRPRSIAASFMSTTSTQRIQSSISSMTRLTFTIPNDLPPTFTYGRILHLQYELNIRIFEKKQKTKTTLWSPPSSLKFISPSCLDEIKVPLIIGTMGHGISIPNDLKNYTDFQGIFGDTVPRSATATVTITPSSPSPTTYPLSRSSTVISRNSLNESNQNNNNNNNSSSNSNNNRDQEIEDQHLPVPKFLPCIEYENTLPMYCPSNLPSYPSSMNNNHFNHYSLSTAT
ncbi:hypothetical protein BJ944DRAFT_267770 [Cunninghamella echinulata]|nr:hypothetical protein BJ944DRAFT_267770 [Cunninghamella echinulata]